MCPQFWLILPLTLGLWLIPNLAASQLSQLDKWSSAHSLPSGETKVASAPSEAKKNTKLKDALHSTAKTSGASKDSERIIKDDRRVKEFARKWEESVLSASTTGGASKDSATLIKKYRQDKEFVNKYNEQIRKAKALHRKTGDSYGVWATQDALGAFGDRTKVRSMTTPVRPDTKELTVSELRRSETEATEKKAKEWKDSILEARKEAKWSKPAKRAPNGKSFSDRYKPKSKPSGMTAPKLEKPSLRFP